MVSVSKNMEDVSDGKTLNLTFIIISVLTVIGKKHITHELVYG